MQNKSVAELIGELQKARTEFSTAADVPRVAAASRALSRIEAALKRPPRIAVFGEFNTGKSSLTNLLIGRRARPTGVVTASPGATLLHYADPPVLHAISDDGGRHKLTSAAYQRLTVQPALTEIGLPLSKLKEYQIIDTVGVSDPSQVEDRALLSSAHNYVHGAIWCTLAPQAWKRSEIALWSSMPERIRQRSLLVVTHIDAIHGEHDLARIADRIRLETQGQFHDMALVSLKHALDALSPSGEIIDHDLWRMSGADEFLEKFGDLVVLASQDRKERAISSVRAIAKRMLHVPIHSRGDIETERLLRLWRQHSDGLDRLSENHEIRDWVQEIVARSRSFGTYSLEPWLFKRMKPQQARDVLALLPIDEGVIEQLVSGLDARGAAARLELIMKQVEAEFSEIFPKLTNQGATPSAEIPPNIREVAQELATWGISASVRGAPAVHEDQSLSWV